MKPGTGRRHEVPEAIKSGMSPGEQARDTDAPVENPVEYPGRLPAPYQFGVWLSFLSMVALGAFALIPAWMYGPYTVEDSATWTNMIHSIRWHCGVFFGLLFFGIGLLLECRDYRADRTRRRARLPEGPSPEIRSLQRESETPTAEIKDEDTHWG